MRSAMPRTPAYAFRKDQERDGEYKSARTSTSPGVRSEMVTRLYPFGLVLAAFAVTRTSSRPRVVRKISPANAQRRKGSRNEEVGASLRVPSRLCAFAGEINNGFEESSGLRYALLNQYNSEAPRI